MWLLHCRKPGPVDEHTSGPPVSAELIHPDIRTQMSITIPGNLRAGPFTLRFDCGGLRYIKWGEHEVIRRIYFAVRDRNWGTIPFEISDFESEISEADFSIRYNCNFRMKEIYFFSRMEITGDSDGSIRISFEGEARSTFLRNRIGLCVLHPIRECAGAKARATYATGITAEITFPRSIASEQPVRGFYDLAGLAHEVEPGVWAELQFEGDLFEMEDQRNWIDASFKTYGTPLRLPFPMEIKAGTRLRQEVRLRLLDQRPNPRMKSVLKQSKGATETVTVRFVGDRTKIPSIGLGASLESDVPDELSIQRLLALKLSHVRVDVRASDAKSSVLLTEQSSDAAILGHVIELAVHLDNFDDWESPAAFLDALGDQLRNLQTPLARILVFGPEMVHSSSEQGLVLARKHLGALGVPIGGGSNADLYQLNLRLPSASADFICWSMNPQVHAFDNCSIAETPEAAAQQVLSVRTSFPDKPLVVSPVTLKPRFNAVATGPERDILKGELPPQVDPRQVSLFAAAWTVAMLKALAGSGANSVTFFETIGWCGVMEAISGSILPEKYPSIPGAVFPVYHVLADVGEFAGGEVLSTESSDPLTIVSLLMQSGKRRRLILANLSNQTRVARIQNLEGFMQARIMDESNARVAMTSPEEFRRSSISFQGTELALGPHAIATLDFKEI